MQPTSLANLSTNLNLPGCKFIYESSDENFVCPDAPWQPFADGFVTIRLQSDGQSLAAQDSVIAIIIWQNEDLCGKFATPGFHLFALHEGDTLIGADVEFGYKDGRSGAWLVVHFTDKNAAMLMETRHLE